MAARLRAAALVVVLVGVGVFLGSAASQWRGGAGVPPDPSFVGDLGVVRVEVLNAGGTPGLAREVTERLRSTGFDVVYFGNADDFGRDSTVVIDRAHRLDAARAVADALGIRNVRSEPDSNLYLDVSVLLGREWGEEVPWDRRAQDAGAPWWDPRGWLR